MNGILRLGMGAGLVAAAAIVAGTAAHGFRIVFPHIHEEMTGAASACLKHAGPDGPNDCLAYYEGFPARTVYFPKVMVAVDKRPSYTDLQRASRWPDDPTLRLKKPLTAVSFVVEVEKKCGERIARSRNLGVAGLLCSSHYGDLQFMHAQASRGEDAELTRDRILDWAAFAFDVASGAQPANAPYCATLRERKSSSRKGQTSLIAAAMAPEPFAFCEGNRGLRKFRAWRVSTFFTFNCRNPFSYKTCPERVIDADAQNVTQMNATGALLHLVQDSFSQAHIRRGPRGRIGHPDTHVAKIVCLPATEYYDYEKQVAAKENHGAADLPPSLDPATCRRGSQIHDPITASAMTLWHIEQAVRHGGGNERFLAYLREHVFG